MIRKRIFNCLLAVTLLMIALTGTPTVVQGSGGPDDGAYIYEDTSDEGGPVYEWDEIATTGSSITLSNNSMSGAIPIPFSFNFYGTEYTSVYISSNGFLTFLASQPNANTPAGIPNAEAPNAIVAGYWGDLDPGAILASANIRYQVLGAAPNRRLVVAFINVPHSGDDVLAYTSSTFEFKLFEGTNNIEIHYNSMNTNGSRHVAGIENADGSIGLSYYDDPADAIANSTAVRFSLFTGVAARPNYEIKYGAPGSTLTFTQRISNWTEGPATFTLTTEEPLPAWPTSIVMGEKNFTTDQLVNGEAATYTIEVAIPEGAVPADSSQVKITVTGGGYSDTVTLVAAVPRRGYALGYYAYDEPYSAILPLDTGFHNSLHEQIDATNLGPFIYFGPTIRPDGSELWVLSQPAQSDDGTETIPPLVYPIPIDSQGNLQVASAQPIDVAIEAADLAFTPDGKTAVISGYGEGIARFIDTATKTLSDSIVTTGTKSFQVATGACFPRKAYITNNGSNSVSIVNVQTQSLIRTITGFNQPYGVVVSPNTNRAFVTNNGNGTIGVIDTLTDTRIDNWTGIGSELTAIDITPDGSRLYVAAGAEVKVINAESGALIATIPTTVDSLFDLKIFPEGMGEFAYATTSNQSYETIQVIDTTNNTVVKEIADDWKAVGLALFPMDTECNVPPVASFTIPAVANTHINVPVPFTNTTEYGATSYVWDFGDGSPTSTDEHPTHTYTDAGPYTVTLTASNSHGSDSDTQTILFGPHAIFTPQQSVISAGDTVSFINSSTGSGTLSYLWNFGDGSPTSTEKDPTHTYTVIGDYTVELTVTSEHNTAGDKATGKVDFAPVAVFTPTESIIRPGESVTFTNQSTGTDTTANPLTYNWAFGDGQTSAEASPTHQYDSGADTTVTLTASNGYGTDSVATGTVKFRPRAQFTPTQIGVIADQVVSFIDQSTGPGTLTYLWDFGDGSPTSTLQDPTHAYTTSGVYTVTQTVTNANGSDTTTGVVGFKPAANFTPSANIIEVNGTVNFNNTTSGPAPITYVWDFGDGSPTSTETSPHHQYTVAGNYTVTLTATNIYGATSKTGTVRFSPTAAFTPTSTVIQLGDPVTFTNQSIGSTPLSYEWDFGDGTATSSAISPNHTYAAAGSYTVTLTVTNEFGSKSTTGVVNFRPKAAFSPEGSTANPLVLHVGDTAEFNEECTGTGPLTYDWNFGDGTTGTGPNPSHKYTSSGNYTVTLTATNDYGSDSASWNVVFAPTAAFEPELVVIRLGDNLNQAITNKSTGSGALAYTWTLGDGSTSTTAVPSHIYSTYGEYDLTLTVKNSYGTATASGKVVFKPRASFVVAAALGRVNREIQFHSEAAGMGEMKLTWDFGDGTPVSHDTDPTHTFTEIGKHTVTLTAENEYGKDVYSMEFTTEPYRQYIAAINR